MAAPEPKTCPHCGGADTETYADGSGMCRACGRAFLGAKATRAMPVGEETERARKAAVVRAKVKGGVLGVVGGILGFLSVPLVFVIGSVVNARNLSTYVAFVFNQPTGAMTCGGLVLLIVSGWYSLWSGYQVWHGFSERWIHMVIAGSLLVVAGIVAGYGIPSVVGVVGGVLTLVGGFLGRRALPKEDEPAAPQTAEA